MRGFFVALCFLTRLPVPMKRHVEADELPSATAFFPWVGCLVGLCTALVLAAGQQVWPIWTAVILALIFEAMLTGAMHEDAVADFFDAFGGGWSRDDVLRILRDSRLGSFGALALICLVALRATTMTDLGAIMIPVVVLAAGAGRWASVVMMAVLPAVSDRPGLAAEVGRRVGIMQVLLGTIWLLPLTAYCGLLRPWHSAVWLLAVGVFLLVFKRFLERRLGGVTGDCLGCLAYLVQVLTLLVFTVDLPIDPNLLLGL